MVAFEPVLCLGSQSVARRWWVPRASVKARESLAMRAEAFLVRSIRRLRGRRSRFGSLKEAISFGLTCPRSA